MAERGYELDPLDRVVDLYQRFRADGETVDAAWEWAVRIVRAVEREAFREAVETDLARLQVTP